MSVVRCVDFGYGFLWEKSCCYEHITPSFGFCFGPGGGGNFLGARPKVGFRTVEETRDLPSYEARTRSISSLRKSVVVF